jgi:hypothetical protein
MLDSEVTPKIVPIPPALSAAADADGEADELTIPVLVPKRNTNRPLVLKLQIRFTDDAWQADSGDDIDSEPRRAVDSR